LKILETWPAANTDGANFPNEKGAAIFSFQKYPAAKGLAPAPA
jgi:hypothetical protein